MGHVQACFSEYGVVSRSTVATTHERSPAIKTSPPSPQQSGDCTCRTPGKGNANRTETRANCHSVDALGDITLHLTRTIAYGHLRGSLTSRRLSQPSRLVQEALRSQTPAHQGLPALFHRGTGSALMGDIAFPVAKKLRMFSSASRYAFCHALSVIPPI